LLALKDDSLSFFKHCKQKTGLATARKVYKLTHNQIIKNFVLKNLNRQILSFLMTGRLHKKPLFNSSIIIRYAESIVYPA